MARRFPQSVYGSGDEPDPRFILANERTALAWVRTSLALLAAGAALGALDLPVEPVLRGAGAAVFLALSLLAAAQSWWGWSRTERAMRRGEPLPGHAAGLVVALGTGVAAAAVGLGLVLR